MLLANEKEQATGICNMMDHGSIILGERSQAQKTICCDSNYVTFQKRHNYGDRKQISDYHWPELGVGTQGKLWGNGNPLYHDCDGGYVTVCSCHDTLNFN